MKRVLIFSCLLIGLSIKLWATENAIKKTQDEQPAESVLSVLLKRVNITGYGQAGYTYNSHEDNGKESNSFEIRRIMLVVNTEVFKNLDMLFMWDVSRATLHEFWADYKFADELKLRAGQFKTPFSIENNLSPANLEIIAGAQSVNYLAGIPATDVTFGGNGGRDMGIMIHGNLIPYQSRKLISYSLGVFNGQGINKRDQNNQKDVSANLMLNVFKEVSIGGSLYIGKGHAQDNSPYGDILKGENYKRNRWGVGAEVNLNPVYFRTEYLQGKDKNIDSEGFYATAKINTLPKFDIILSYDYFLPARKIKQTNYIVGGQWNFYRRCRLQAQYIYQDKSDLKNANMVMAQLQVGF